MQKEELKKRAQIALDSNLFVDGWLLRNVLKAITEGSNHKIVLHYVNEEPVGCCVSKESGLLMTYVKPEHRRKGIASLMLDQLIVEFNLDSNKLFGRRGDKGSESFYLNNGIQYRG